MMQNGLRFRTAALQDFPCLKKMWQDCFDDTAESAEHIFKHLQKPENILVLADESKPVAMLSVLEFGIVAPDTTCNAAYLYGVATSPQEQGKGLGTALLDETDIYLQNRGYACATLVPASGSLFGYYAKRGYKTAFDINKVKLAAAEIDAGNAFPLEKLDAKELSLLRGKSFGDSKMFARWGNGYLDYIVKESEFYGGGTFVINIDGVKICAVCHKSGGTVYIKELGASQDTLAAAIRSIHAYFCADEYQIYLRADFMTNYENRLLPFAMLKWYDNKAATAVCSGNGAPAYIAHVLD